MTMARLTQVVEVQGSIDPGLLDSARQLEESLAAATGQAQQLSNALPTDDLADLNAASMEATGGLDAAGASSGQFSGALAGLQSQGQGTINRVLGPFAGALRAIPGPALVAVAALAAVAAVLATITQRVTETADAIRRAQLDAPLVDPDSVQRSQAIARELETEADNIVGLFQDVEAIYLRAQNDPAFRVGLGQFFPAGELANANNSLERTQILIERIAELPERVRGDLLRSLGLGDDFEGLVRSQERFQAAFAAGQNQEIIGQDALDRAERLDELMRELRQNFSDFLAGLQPVAEFVIDTLSRILNIINAVIDVLSGDFSSALDRVRQHFGFGEGPANPEFQSALSAASPSGVLQTNLSADIANLNDALGFQRAFQQGTTVTTNAPNQSVNVQVDNINMRDQVDLNQFGRTIANQQRR